MLRPRILLPHGGCYHCISRVVDRRFIFGTAEMNYFHATMRRLEAFLGVRVLTYCLMSNHFHLLVEIPDPDSVPPLTAGELRRRLPFLYHGKRLVELLDELDRADAASCSGKSSQPLDAILDRYRSRMADLTVFLKELKQRFAQWYNLRNARCGILWEDRFKSVLVDGEDEHALMTMAAYIELNPVRAGLVDDPKDYRWCGYAEAVAGRKTARSGLIRMHTRTRAWQGRGETWRHVAPAYRIHLFGKGEQRIGTPGSTTGCRKGIDPKRVAKVIETERGRLATHELLRCRARYFCDGVVFGRAAFVEEIFESHRQQFSSKRKSGARTMRGGDWQGLSTIRDLRKDVFGQN